MRISTARKHFFLGVNTGLTTDGLPDDRCCNFYSERSGHGLYCAIVGNVVIPSGIGTNERTPEISDSLAWRQLSRAIESRGALPGIQLATTWEGYSGQKSFIAKSSALEIERYREIVEQIPKERIRELFSSLRIGTELAIAAGFRHIQLHAAHGYLFSLLIDRRIYSRADETIGETIEWANRTNAHGIEVSVRFSLRTGDRAFDESGRLEFLELMASLPVNYLDVSSGFYDINKQLIYPSIARHLRERREDTLSLANDHTEAQFIYSGKSMHDSEVALPPNMHIGIGRDLIANPDFMRDRSRGCVNRMKCHWYSRGADHIRCGRWKFADPTAKESNSTE